jgi:hypothetical protein
MVKQYGQKALTVMIIGAFLIMGLSSLALAQKGQELKDAHKMMSDAFKIADDGSKMIEKGMTMNIKVAEAKGAIEKFA